MYCKDKLFKELSWQLENALFGKCNEMRGLPSMGYPALLFKTHEKNTLEELDNIFNAWAQRHEINLVTLRGEDYPFGSNDEILARYLDISKRINDINYNLDNLTIKDDACKQSDADLESELGVLYEKQYELKLQIDQLTTQGVMPSKEFYDKANERCSVVYIREINRLNYKTRTILHDYITYHSYPDSTQPTNRSVADNLLFCIASMYVPADNMSYDTGYQPLDINMLTRFGILDLEDFKKL